MKLNELHHDVPALEDPIRGKVLRFGHKRLRSWEAERLPCMEEPAVEFVVPTVENSQIEIGELLGKGSFSAAYEIKSIKDRPTNDLVVKVLQPKLVQKPSLFAGCASDIVREGMILSQLSHPHVLSCRAYSPNGIEAFSNGRHDAFVLVLDRLEGTLKESVDIWRSQTKKRGLSSFFGKKKRMQKTICERTDLVCDLASAVAYLHSQRVLHRDLKPANIGITADGCLKVFDLDVCKILPQEALTDSNKSFKFTRRVGSPRYMAPEVANSEPYNAKADVYSFALLAYEVLSLKKPFSDLGSQAHDEMVFKGTHRPHIPGYWPREVKQTIETCWAKDPKDRPTMKDVLFTLRDELNLLCPASEIQQYLHHKAMHSQSEEEGRTVRSGVLSLFEQ